MMEVKQQLLVCGAIMGGLSRPSWAFLLLMMTVITLLGVQISTNTVFPPWVGGGGSAEETPSSRRSCAGFFREGTRRKVVMSITDFGGVGDGRASNTAAFRRAIQHMQGFGERGGAQLNVPRGTWVTGSFNLTSNFTLFLQQGAIILGSQDPKEWPIIEPLPSYGRGRERMGGRHISLIHGDGLSDVIITGTLIYASIVDYLITHYQFSEYPQYLPPSYSCVLQYYSHGEVSGQNGTIDGQGKMWWDMWWNRTLKHTRGHLLELMNSSNVLISNLTFRNSPFWTIHPVYCSNVVIKNMIILAPLNAPNTDGIDPDSSINVCIEDCYIESGDDLVAVKSGWDQYGIAMARPSSNIIIRRVSGTTPTCSGVGIGSEMSGGISNVIVEDLRIRDSAAGMRIKTDKGRGGYISNITVNNITMERVKIPIRFSRGANDHPDEGWDPKAMPKVKGIFISNVISIDSLKAPLLEGIEGAPYEGICMRSVSILGLPPSAKWNCEFVLGFTHGVTPLPCPQLQSNRSSSWCSYS